MTSFRIGPSMPSFKDMLTDAQMNDLVAYLISLKPKGEDLGF